MTTKTAGGRISSRIALTMEAQSALDVGDPVSIVGDYECDTADSGDTFVGVVTRSNKRRAGNNAAAEVVPGDVTVECPGSMVLPVTAGAIVAAGDEIHLTAAGAYVPAGNGGVVGARVGIALTGAANAATFDCLFD